MIQGLGPKKAKNLAIQIQILAAPFQKTGLEKAIPKSF